MKIRDIRHWLSVCEDVRKNPDHYSKTVVITQDTMLMLADEIQALKTKIRSLQMQVHGGDCYNG